VGNCRINGAENGILDESENGFVIDGAPPRHEDKQ
jgi:hypothetical protein